MQYLDLNEVLQIIRECHLYINVEMTKPVPAKVNQSSNNFAREYIKNNIELKALHLGDF